MTSSQTDNQTPRVANSAWIADGAQVLGNVELAQGSSIWFGAIVQGNSELVRIGCNSNVQDGSLVQSEQGYPLTVGDNVTVGHRVQLYGCVIGDGCLIGMQSIVHKGAKIGNGCLVAAGSVVAQGVEFADGVMIMGSPARVARMLTPVQIEGLLSGAKHYVENAKRYQAGLKRVG
jgi:carbonic anhydrase/acetyltransferase-like protein (isoleucine patch superfamily)